MKVSPGVSIVEIDVSEYVPGIFCRQINQLSFSYHMAYRNVEDWLKNDCVWRYMYRTLSYSTRYVEFTDIGGAVEFKLRFC